MRIFTAKRDITILTEPPSIIHKGQMFFLDCEEDLPDFNFLYGEELNPIMACNEDWEEVEITAGSGK